MCITIKTRYYKGQGLSAPHRLALSLNLPPISLLRPPQPVRIPASAASGSGFGCQKIAHRSHRPGGNKRKARRKSRPTPRPMRRMVPSPREQKERTKKKEESTDHRPRLMKRRNDPQSRAEASETTRSSKLPVQSRGKNAPTSRRGFIEHTMGICQIAGVFPQKGTHPNMGSFWEANPFATVFDF